MANTAMPNTNTRSSIQILSFEELVEQLMERLRPTFGHTFEVLLKGIAASNI